MKSVARSEFVEETELEGLAFATATFFDSLSKVRPEIGHLDRIGRNWVREHLLVDAAVMFHGFGALASDYLIDIPHRGSTSALAYLDDKLQHLSSSNEYRYESWTGDLFDKNNPVWEYIGVLRRNPKTRRMTTLNTGAARGACQRIMRRIIRLDEFERDLLKFVEE